MLYLAQCVILQYLAEPTAAALKGCGYALQPKPRRLKDPKKTKKCSENARFEAHVCLFGFTVHQLFFVYSMTSKKNYSFSYPPDQNRMVQSNW